MCVCLCVCARARVCVRACPQTAEQLHKVAEKEKEELDQRLNKAPDRQIQLARGSEMAAAEAPRSSSRLYVNPDGRAERRGRADALELMRRFAPLLAAVRKTEGRQVRRRTVGLTMRNLGECLGMEEDAVVTRVAEDLRRMGGDVEVLTVESFQLRAPPAWVGGLENLKSLAVGADFDDFCGVESECIREIPASIGELGALRELRLQGLTNVEELAEGMKRLTGLEVLCVEGCGMQAVPGWIGEMGGLRELTLGKLAVEELPEEMGRLPGLQTLELKYLGALEEVPASVGGLTGLESLEIDQCYALGELPASTGRLTGLLELYVWNTAMRDMPASVEALTALRRLTVGGCGHSSKAYKTLARCLPSMRLLGSLDLRTEAEEDGLAIGRSLRAWPPPRFRECSKSYASGELRLRGHWRGLGLPAEAAEWRDIRIAEHLREQQSKVAAFASGLHRRLGAGSMVSQLDEQVLVLIAEEVLGGWSLMRSGGGGGRGLAARSGREGP